MTPIRTVGIIGAGISGLVTAKTLMAEGFSCTVFERGPTLGGVWADGYSNFGVQVQKELYQIPDWPLPEDVPSFTPGPEVQRYLEEYASHWGVTPHIEFGCEVVGMDPRADGEAGFALTVRRGGEAAARSFDLVVVCVGLYSEEPYRPEFPGRDAFRGDVLHISELKSRAPLEGRRVAVVGFGKSATDAALESAAVANETHLLVRDPHWPIPRKLAGVLPFKWGLLNRLTVTLLPLYKNPTPLERAVHGLGRPLVWLWWRLVEALLRAQHGLGRTIEDGANLVPERPIEIDAFSESVMLPRPEFYRSVRTGRIRAHRAGIRQFTEAGVELANGRQLDLDVLVLATGWRTSFACLGTEVGRALGIEEDGLYLYRQILHPAEPRLAFVGQASSISSMLTYSLQARWIAEWIAGRVSLPEREAMREEIEAMKRWKRSFMPASAARSARLIGLTQHYHDELLRDIGADPLRKRGLFAPLKELLAPYEGRDYREIVSGTWRRD